MTEILYSRREDLAQIQERRARVRRWTDKIVDSFGSPDGSDQSMEGLASAIGKSVDTITVLLAALYVGIGERTADEAIGIAASNGVAWSPDVCQRLRRLEVLHEIDKRLIAREVRFI